ncbi:hypothetical protein IKF23_02855 [Candidatus Saccharibacteria bacterium]|nr:hypothetical protein [Candidatus Saccharibacteria bacterium]
MLRHQYLHDPVERTADMNITEFTKYTDIVKSQTGPTEDGLVKEIEKRYLKFVDKHSSTEEDRSQAMKAWEFVLPKIEINAGLANFILDYDGAESLYFFPWLINVFRSPSTALEMAYGAGENIFGEWKYDMTDDPIDFFVKNDPTFVYNRERQLYVADLASSICDNAMSASYAELPSKIVDFGAGRLAWARWHGFKFASTHVSINAYDKDSSIDFNEVFNVDNAEEALGIRFKHGDLMAFVNDPEAAHADLVILGGVASYIHQKVFAQAVVMPIYHLLNRGGMFFFDLQIDCPYLRRSMAIFDWPKMYLDGRSNVTETIAEVEQMRKQFWHEGLKFGAEYAVDTYNESPSALMVTMQKI